MLQEQGDRVQLLPLNADTHAENKMRTHTRTITISTGSARFKAFVFIEGFALAPPPTVFHLTVGRGFLLLHSEDLGLCLSVYGCTYGSMVLPK